MTIYCSFSYLEQVISDHERTIRELEEENAGVYELLTEQRIIADLPEIMETSYQPRFAHLSTPAALFTQPVHPSLCTVSRLEL